MRKLYLSIATFTLILALFTTTTFAWISLASVNSIKEITMSTITGYELEMSLDGINYYTSEEGIPKELLIEKTSKVRFKDITSLDGVNFKKNLHNDDIGIKGFDYISLDFYFRTTSRYQELHLTDNIINVPYNKLPNEGTFITSKGVNYVSPYRYLYGPNDYVEKGEIRKYYGKDALRVSFLDHFDNSAKIFDLSGNEERGFGKPYGAMDFLYRSTNINVPIPQVPNTIYKMSKFSTDAPYALTYDSLISTLQLSEEVDSNNKPYYKSKVTMNVWLEGFDADAFDAVFGDQLKMQFMFRTVFPKQ